MTNETKFYRGTQKTLTTTLAAISNNTLSASCGTYSATDTLDYTDAEFAIKITFASAPTENSAIDVHIRPLDIQSTNDAQTPTSTYRPGFGCSCSLDDLTSAQWIFGVAEDIPKAGEVFLYNNNTGQACSANVEVYMTPRTRGPL